MTIFARTWDASYEADPAGGDFIGQGDDRIRDLKEDIRERLEVDHSWVGDALDGEHKKVTFFQQSSDPATVADKGYLYTKDVAGIAELFWKNDAGTVFQLTSEGALLEVAYLNLGNIFTANQTISDDDAGAGVDPDLNLFRDSVSPAVNDAIGRIRFSGKNDADGTVFGYARIRGIIVDPSAGVEDGRLLLETTIAGTPAERIRIQAGLSTSLVTGGDKGLDSINQKSLYIEGIRPFLSIGATYTTTDGGGTFVRTSGSRLLRYKLWGGGGGGGGADNVTTTEGGGGGGGSYAEGEFSLTDLTFVPGDVNTGTDVITVTGNTFQDDDKVRVSTDGTLPSPLLVATTYFIVGKSGDDIQLSATKGGAAINLATTGSGIHTIVYFEIDFSVGGGGLSGGTGGGNGNPGGLSNLSNHAITPGGSRGDGRTTNGHAAGGDGGTTVTQNDTNGFGVRGGFGDPRAAGSALRDAEQRHGGTSFGVPHAQGKTGNANGTPGRAPGGGGSGGRGDNGSGSSGGDGADGHLILEEFM